MLSRDVLHPNRANVSKDEMRSKLSEMYKASKDQVSVFGFRTHYGGGKSTGFALIYDSVEALKKFEPHYRLVRIGQASKIEKPSRQQRMFQDQVTPKWEAILGPVANLIALLQVSNAKIVQRQYEEQQRRRVRPRKRRSRLDNCILWLFGLVQRLLAVFKHGCNVTACHSIQHLVVNIPVEIILVVSKD